MLHNDPNLKYEIKMSNSKGSDVHVTNLREEEVLNEDQIETIIKEARKNRACAKTLANERSSRSHSVFMLRIEGFNTATSESCCGTLNLVSSFTRFVSIGIKYSQFPTQRPNKIK